MKKSSKHTVLVLSIIIVIVVSGCHSKGSVPSEEAITAINLKRGDIISCGPADMQLGSVDFDMSCPGKIKKEFNTALSLLHSFEYDEAEKVFASIIDKEPGCAMAYWGVAMSNYHPLWTPPLKEELEKGAKAIAVAKSIGGKNERETAYIDAIGTFYEDWEKTGHAARSVRFMKAMEQVYASYPKDKDAALFYALALTATASPTDTTFTNQKKAGNVLTSLDPGNNDHPGLVHYIIHTYDSPELAALALPAARKYASIAPSSAHALHMPSHIFTRLGLWDEGINTNLNAAASAKCYAEGTGIDGHWDEELHCIDYLVYAYLQKGENHLAKKQLDYLGTMKKVSPLNFKVAYAFASVPSRYALENRNWEAAAALEKYPADLSWKEYPWQEAIIHFTRALGAVNTGKLDAAKMELQQLKDLQTRLLQLKDAYKANQVLIQLKTAEAWIKFREGKNKEALTLMTSAANMEDTTQKHPVTPNEVLPARELLGDMLLQMNEPALALVEYERNLKSRPNRFNGLYGAAIAAEKINNKEKARKYFQQLVNISNMIESDRPELKTAKQSLGNQQL